MNLVVVEETGTDMTKPMKSWNGRMNKMCCVFAIQAFVYIDRKESE